ncbi:MAG: endonuclease/exonuclease/phosphatase family protein [Imperialibacter sp.]|uniref:endonuclease/exonuclease/phosphatase family protein n=1 Tax=Imperialibacter sp. TaxID=2038411 RepID=UPI0032ECEB2F
MKIVTWNCNGAFRRKFEHISKLNADIYIIQECEDPNQSNHSGYMEWSSNYLWIGDSKNKGLGIFAKPEIEITALDWPNTYRDHSVKYFLPCVVNKEFQLLGVWAHSNKSPNFGYIGQFWKYLQTNFELFDKIIIAGDFNSNAIWDEWDRWWNHTDVLNSLQEKGIVSLYHLTRGEEQGKEITPTFFLQKKPGEPYHIDYFFASKHFHSPRQFHIEPHEKWIRISDHVPLVLKT